MGWCRWRPHRAPHAPGFDAVRSAIVREVPPGLMRAPRCPGPEDPISSEEELGQSPTVRRLQRAAEGRPTGALPEVRLGKVREEEAQWGLRPETRRTPTSLRWER